MSGLKPVYIHPIPKLGGNFARYSGKMMFSLCTNTTTWGGLEIHKVLNLAREFEPNLHEYVYGFYSDKELSAFMVILKIGDKKIGVSGNILKTDQESTHYYVNGEYIKESSDNTYHSLLGQLLKGIYNNIYSNILNKTKETHL